MSEWISVENRLPADEGRVLIFAPPYDPDHPMCYRIIDAQFVQLCREATHWMPLPEPPK